MRLLHVRAEQAVEDLSMRHRVQIDLVGGRGQGEVHHRWVAQGMTKAVSVPAKAPARQQCTISGSQSWQFWKFPSKEHGIMLICQVTHIICAARARESGRGGGGGAAPMKALMME